jgi:hypothetical protein
VILETGWAARPRLGPDWCVESHWVKPGQVVEFKAAGVRVVNTGRRPAALFLVESGAILSGQPIAFAREVVELVGAIFTQEALF